jgi:hypothetical protein
MKIKLVKTKYCDEIFYVKLNEKLSDWGECEIYERIDDGYYYHIDNLILIKDFNHE